MRDKPNDIPRLQFLAVLEYLLTKTDSEHLSSTNDIMAFAEEEYGVSLRREQAKDIVEHIYELCQSRKKVLPYEIRQAPKPIKHKRYYVAKKRFDVDVIVKVCAAIKNDKTIDAENTNLLIEQLVNDYVVLDQQQAAEKKIKQRTRRTNKMSREKSNLLDHIYSLGYSKHIFEFYLKAITSDVFEQSCTSYTRHRFTIAPRTRYQGVVITLEENDETHLIYAYIYIQTLGAIIKTRFDNVEIASEWDVEYSDDVLEASAQNIRDYRLIERAQERGRPTRDPNKTVREVMEIRWGRRIFPRGREVVFKFCIGTPERRDDVLFSKVKRSFEDFYETPMVYEEREREIVFGAGTENEKRVTALDVYVTVSTTFFRFEEWVKEKAHIIDNVVVMTPELRRWNDMLVGRLISLYVNRLNKYGYAYKYNLSWDKTAEYEAYLERIREMSKEDNNDPANN